MDVKILDSHLREYLDTNAKAIDIAKYVSLCGPTFDRTNKLNKDYLYEIEVTTNRVDTASVIGIAREAAAILPQFGIGAKPKKLPRQKIKVPQIGLPLILKSDPKLVNRLTAVVIEDIQNWESPQWMKDRLEAAGIRSLNAVVDITNYVMITIGHPSHVFDYDKIKDHTIIVRESKKGEKIITLDGKTHALPGGDIVFVNKDNKIIDLPGIMGTKNSLVSETTKRVLFLFDNNDPVSIRRTSMSLAVRTIAATLNEKGVSSELIPDALNLGVNLFEKICKAKIASKVFDVYPKPYKEKTVLVTREFIEKLLGIAIDKKKVLKLLSSLEFDPKWKGETLEVKIPSFREKDIDIPEDIVEEIARIYGYHNLPSKLMTGELPVPRFDTTFRFEESIRANLKSLGGVEVLTYSLVTAQMAGENALKLKNPLGKDTEYLRTSLKPSLINALKENTGVESAYHLFEIANIYLLKKNDLPEEKMMLGGVLVNYNYREAKGTLEVFFESLNIQKEVSFEQVGKNIYYYQFEILELKEKIKPKTFKPAPKYPPQVEDMTIEIPEGKHVGEVIQSIKQADKLVYSVELVDVYDRKFTFRISYLHPEKTLSDKEVEKVREKIEKII